MNSITKNLIIAFLLLQLLVLVHAQTETIPPKLSGSLEFRPIETSDIGFIVIVAGAGGLLGHILGKIFDKLFLDPLIDRIAMNPLVKKVRKVILNG